MENPASNIYPASPSEQHQHHLNSSNNNKTYSQQYQRDEYHQFRLPPPSNFNFNYTPLPTPAAQTSSITDAMIRSTKIPFWATLRMNLMIPLDDQKFWSSPHQDKGFAPL
ncbi:5219_t:CDS:2 [Entrophospora sp. SA101]|nr:5219_t:CDS:2 [Entrophospora sp. SA101]